MLKLTLAFFAGFLLFQVKAFSISNIEVVGSGGDEEDPAEEDKSLELRCNIQNNDDDVWNFCEWIHVIEGEYDNNNKEMTVVCPGTVDSHGRTCSNIGGTPSMDSLSQRITMNIGQQSCGLVINKAHSSDNGEWSCNVHGASISKQFDTIDVFVTNQSMIHISDPDTLEDKNAVIEYDLLSSRPQIEATCMAQYGIPKPTFKWYVDDTNRNEIDRDDLNPRSQESNNKNDNWASEEITWSPTRYEICSKYNLGSTCDSNDDFTFNLICMVEQNNFYSQENSNQEAKVLVELKNGGMATAALGSLVFTLATLLVSGKLH